MARASHEAIATSPGAAHTYPADKKDLSQVERVLSAEDEKVDHVNFERIDDEVAKYANATGSIEISEEENRRLKKLVDRRVLPVMVFTYFLQALDKGTMSFTSIMGIRNDIPILKQNSYVSNRAGRCSLQQLTDFYSGDGSPPVSTLPFFSLNTPPTGSFSVSQSENTSHSTFWHGALYCAVTLSASAFLLLSAFELCSVFSRPSASRLSFS